MSDTNENEITATTTAAEPSIEFRDILTSSEKKKLKKQRKSSVKRSKTEHGFMYIGHIPHGFYEEEMKSYFSQFGRVVKIRLARSIQTGNHKGYGFIEFDNIEVARIAAETMNNYLMFNRILKCHLIPKEKLHKLTFKNARKPFHIRLASKLRQRFNATKSVEKLKQIEARNKDKMAKRQLKLKEMGINLDLSKLLNKQTVNKVENVESVPSVKEATKPATSKSTEQTQKKPVTKTDKKAVSAPVVKKTKPAETKQTPNAKKLKSKK